MPTQAIDLAPHMVVTLHTPAGDVPIVADPSTPTGSGTVNVMGFSIPYDVQLVFGMPAPGPNDLWGNIQNASPYLVLGGAVLLYLLLNRRRR